MACVGLADRDLDGTSCMPDLVICAPRVTNVRSAERKKLLRSQLAGDLCYRDGT